MAKKLIIIILTLLYAGPAAMGQKEFVDGVIAVVEDEAVFYGDLDQMVKQYMMQRGAQQISPADRRILEKQALEDLINNKLIVLQAGKLGIKVPYSEVEKNVANALEENKKLMGGEDAFKRQLELEGLSLQELENLYREQMRERMLIERVLASEIDKSKINVSEQELNRTYETRKNDLARRPEVVRLATILFAFKSSLAAEDEARNRIEKIRSDIAGGLDFTKAAKKFSEDPSAQMGGDLGFMKLEDIQDHNFITAARDIKPGEVSPPVRTSFGYHLIKMVEKSPNGSEAHIQHILIRVKPGEKDIEAVFSRARAVHDSLLAGAEFDSMAVRYSDETSSASSGGDLGWIKVADLPDFFRDVLKELKINDISPVLRESAGFRIVRLLGREEEREYTFNEVKDELRRNLEQEKMRALYDDYIKDLRKKHYVDIRN